ncbi:MAG: tyrosine-type recombinase/integrase [Pseudomonadota bacterium]|nr:tyrosine-type recombinase/integrase [Pseudomonadota bacterium]
MSVRKRKWINARGVEKEAWQVDYTDQHGKRRSKQFKLKKVADEFAAKTHVEVLGNIHVADSETITVAEAGNLWLKSSKAAGLERTTLSQYAQHLNLHIIPFIGRQKLNKLTVPSVRAFLDRLRTGDASLAKDDPCRRPRSDAMVRNVRVSLGSILSDAQERGLIVRNAVKEMGRERPGRANAQRRHEKPAEVGTDIPTVDEVKRILSHATGPARIFLLTATFTGMRASELRGMHWDDINFDKREITVRQRADAYNDIGSPKSRSGRRTIPIGRELTNELREWKLQCPKGKLGLVFPNGKGNIEYHANIVKRWYHPAQLAAGVAVKTGEVDEDGAPIMEAKYSGLHALRHFYASFCINRPEDGGLGLPPKVVQSRLGHSSIQMTLDVYGHLFPRGDSSEELDRAEAALFT